MQNHQLSASEIQTIVTATQGYSGSDLQKLCDDALLGPLHDEEVDILTVKEEEIRPVAKKDFDKSMLHIRASVNQLSIEKYKKWNEQFGLSL